MKIKATIVCLIFAILIAIAPSSGTLLIEQDWVKYQGNPILYPGSAGSWEGAGIGHPSVIKDGNSYKMWYTGCSDGAHCQIGYATSVDGFTWTKYIFNPVLTNGPTGSWEEVRVENPAVIKDGELYKMWYDGRNTANIDQIGYAESTDGINWIKYSSNPVLSVGPLGSWDSIGVSGPTVIKNGDSYEMWFDGHGSGPHKIGYATSTDGITWIKYASNPILDVVPSTWESSQLYTPSVIEEGGLYKMWYAASGSGGLDRIGYAESSDGVTWTKSPWNPVLDYGASGEWDSSYVGHPSVICEGEQYRLWYGGHGGPDWAIGLAEWTVPPISPEINIDPDTICLGSEGEWITCYIELPEGYDVKDIDASSILLEDTLSPELDPKYGFVVDEESYIVDEDGDGILERMVKFDRDEVEKMLSPGTYNLKVTGELEDGTVFEGYSDEIKVINPP